MRNRYGHSDEFKKLTVQKFLTRGNRKVIDIANEAGIKTPTLYDWRDKFANTDGMKKPSKPQSRSTSEKLKTIVEYSALSVEERGKYLRQNGLHEENIEHWKDQIEEALSPKKKSFHEKQELVAEQKKVKQLEKEILRKDKALAEVSALLVLKKKADLIWGSEEDE